jgi:DNA-binding protein
MTGDGSHYDKITTPKLQKRHIVKTVTVENILKNYDFDKIDILKMDIEGAEKEVFNDCDKWINSVSSIVVELHERMKKGCEEAFEKIRGNFSNISKYGEDIFLYSS